MQHASGRYQFTERSVGKPGIFVMAKNVPLNAYADRATPSRGPIAEPRHLAPGR
jgi:hypothetical protein